jgi:flagellar biosynthesis/type III secretory pathway protein FliH
VKRLFEWDEFETEDEQDEPVVDELKKMFAFLSPDQIQLLKDLDLEMEKYNILWDLLDEYGETKYEEGEADGKDVGYDQGYDLGYEDGYDEAKDEFETNI